MKRMLSLVMVLCLIMSMGIGAQAQAHADGTYSATKPGFGGAVTVTVTVAGGVMTDIAAQGDQETSGIGSKAIEQLPTLMLTSQSAAVDAIAGATVTSTAVIDAVQTALNEAQGIAVASVKMAPGTYTTEEYGFQQIAPITVTLTVDEDSILDITMDGNKDSVAMVRSVETYLLPRIVENQSCVVDAISGATATSNAVLIGARNLLKQALVAGGSDESAITHFEAPAPVVDSLETIDVDVVVVGLGAAGTAACLSAAETQADAGEEVSVLGIDRAGRWGGTGAFTGSIMAVNAEGIKSEFNGDADYMDGEDLYNTWLTYTEGDAKENIIQKIIDNSGDTIDWLYYDHGMLLNEPMAYFGSKWACVYDYVSRNTYVQGHPYSNEYEGTEAVDGQNTMVDKYYQRLYNDFEALGGRYMLETTGYELIYDEANNVVTGVLAEGHDGSTYQINAGKVILVFF